MDVTVGSDGNCHSTAMLIIQTMFFSLSSISFHLLFLSFPLSFSLCLSLDARACTHTHPGSSRSWRCRITNKTFRLCCAAILSHTTRLLHPPSHLSLCLSFFLCDIIFYPFSNVILYVCFCFFLKYVCYRLDSGRGMLMTTHGGARAHFDQRHVRAGGAGDLE